MSNLEKRIQSIIDDITARRERLDEYVAENSEELQADADEWRDVDEEAAELDAARDVLAYVLDERMVPDFLQDERAQA